MSSPQTLTPSIPYVEYGGRAGAPPPFRSTEGRFRAWLVKGEANLIEQFVERVLNVPAEGAVRYSPIIGEYLLLQTGSFGSVVSEAPGFQGTGFVEEAQISLWVPVWSETREEGGGYRLHSLGMACPFIVVDNPLSLVGGREDYGYPKTLGRFDPATGVGDPLTVEVFGGDYSPTEKAGWHTLFQISGEAAPAAAPQWIPLEDAAAHITDDLLGLELPDLELIKKILALLTGKETVQVFLKQFRDTARAGAACYQAVVEAPLEFLSSSVAPALQTWTIAIDALDSHPIARELGVAPSQTVRFCLDVRMDMLVEPGQVVAPPALAAP